MSLDRPEIHHRIVAQALTLSDCHPTLRRTENTTFHLQERARFFVPALSRVRSFVLIGDIKVCNCSDRKLLKLGWGKFQGRIESLQRYAKSRTSFNFK